jgi:heat-inducible transcriptional repressor
MSHLAFPGRLSQDDPDLTERQLQVFLAVVHRYDHTARPVSSEALVASSAVRGSAPTVRAVLAELEAAGLLTRTHAASGRVPTAAGYAYFVRQALTPAPLPAELLREIDDRLARSTRAVEDLLHEAARVLSGLSLQLGLAVSRPLDDERLNALELAPLAPERALLVLTLGGGGVRTLKLELDSPLEPDTLAGVERVLRERLTGLHLREVRDRLLADPELVRDTVVHAVAAAFALAWGAASDDSTTLFAAGAGRIAAWPEFSAPGQLGSLLQVLEDGPPLDRLLVDGAEGIAEVRLALEESEALVHCSLVRFPLPGPHRMAIGVLGPLRMDYARALAVVDAVGSRLAARL